ncbi:MAG: NAD-binding protein [Deltaproteobacteria bacterium]|nr:NAD-binding protein [Deltaproteobacteria bacterium]
MDRIGFLGLGTMGLPMAVNMAKAGLMEGAGFAQKAGLDRETFFRLILGGPLGNDMFAIKAKKIMEGDFAPQASIGTVREMLKHITDTAYEMNASIPNTLSNVNLIAAAMDLGLAEEDACAIIKVFWRPPAVRWPGRHPFTFSPQQRVPIMPERAKAFPLFFHH